MKKIHPGNVIARQGCEGPAQIGLCGKTSLQEKHLACKLNDMPASARYSSKGRESQAEGARAINATQWCTAVYEECLCAWDLTSAGSPVNEGQNVRRWPTDIDPESSR